LLVVVDQDLTAREGGDKRFQGGTRPRRRIVVQGEVQFGPGKQTFQFVGAVVGQDDKSGLESRALLKRL
jgi:hypothetical protein